MICKLKCNKIMISLILTIFVLICFNNYANAASFSITSGISSIELGKTYTITIKAPGLTGKFNITHSSNVSVNVNSVFVDNGTAESTIKVTTKEAGKATVTITADSEFGVSDSNGLVTLSPQTDTVTVKAKSNSTSDGSNSTDTTTKPTFTSKNETVYAKSEVNVRSSYSTSSSKLGTLQAGDSVTRTGIATKSIDGILWSKVTYNGKTAYISSSFLTTTKPEVKNEEDKNEENNSEDNKKDEENKEDKKSDNTNLKTLEVTPTGLSPTFSNITTEYTMTVGSDIDKIEVKAVAESEKATVTISGNEDLKIGDNKVLVKVTAEDKTEKTYTITVTKEEKEQLKLSELLIEGLPLEPEFDSNVYQYTLTLDRNDISELNITATPSEKSAEIEIVGNTELKPGENVITILVRSADGEEITTYQITANLPELVQDIATVENSDLYKYIGIGIAVVVLLIIIVVFVRKSRKNEDDEFIDYSDLYNRRKKQEEVIEANNKLVENQREINLEELPKLDDEDLPKSLRKNNKEELAEKENSKNGEIQEEQSERSKKIDELYAMSSNDKPRKKGKHF